MWGPLTGKRSHGDPSEPLWEWSISLDSLGFAFSPAWLLPPQLGQETFISLEDWLPLLLKGQKTGLHLHGRIAICSERHQRPLCIVSRQGQPWEEDDHARHRPEANIWSLTSEIAINLLIKKWACLQRISKHRRINPLMAMEVWNLNNEAEGTALLQTLPTSFHPCCYLS